MFLGASPCIVHYIRHETGTEFKKGHSYNYLSAIRNLLLEEFLELQIIAAR